MRNPTMDEIFEAVYCITGVHRSQMVGPRRFRPYARARQTVAYIAALPGTRTLGEIGRLLGGRDHSTIAHAIDIIEILKTDDPVWRARLGRIEAILEERTREHIDWNAALAAKTKTAEACFANPGGPRRDACMSTRTTCPRSAPRAS